MLVGQRHTEIAEEQSEHEDVVDREALFDQVAAKVLAGSNAAECHPDERPEGQPHGDPYRAPASRFADGHLVSIAVKRQVDGEHAKDEGHDRRPDPPLDHQEALRRVGNPRCAE